MRSLFFALFVFCLLSCAHEVEENARNVEERLLQARIHEKYLDTLHTTESGMYYMIQAKGSGAQVGSENYVYVRYSVLDFFYENYMRSSGETYYDSYGYSQTSASELLTSEELVAKQLGEYSQANYYGPVLWFTGVYALMEGLDEMLMSMREGDRRRIWLPSWLSSYGMGSSNQYSFTTIYDVEVVKAISDIEKFEIDSLESYRDKYYPGLDSLAYGFYKKTLKEGTGDTLTTGNSVSILYVGRFLDHFIFDLNLADTAKKYNIFDSSRDYNPLTGMCGEDEKVETTDTDGNTKPLVAGFSKAVFNMKHGEEAVVFFYSTLGYGNEKQDKIQPFTPLVFYLKVERTDNLNEDT